MKFNSSIDQQKNYKLFSEFKQVCIVKKKYTRQFFNRIKIHVNPKLDKQFLVK